MNIFDTNLLVNQNLTTLFIGVWMQIVDLFVKKSFSSFGHDIFNFVVFDKKKPNNNKKID